MIPKATNHEFWKSIHAGANKAGRELGVEILWKGPMREDDRDEQVKVVEDFVARRVDGIVLAPTDNRALVPPAKEAARRGIPIVIIDSGIEWDEMVSFVATDNYKGGVIAADRLGQLLHDGGKVILLRYQVGSASTMNREAGFLDTMRAKYPNVEIASSNQHGGATTESAYAVAERLLIQFDIDGVFCPNESTTFGMLRALQDAGRAGKGRFVGFDSSAKLVEALANGELHGLVVQNPFRMGELGVQTLVAHLDGVAQPKRVDTGVMVATKENMDQPDVKILLQPDLAQWLE